MKKFFLLIATSLCLSLIFSGACFAQTQAEDISSQLDKLAEKYNVEFKPAAEIPDGITPIVYDSVEDFEKDLIKHQKYVQEQEALAAKSKEKKISEIDSLDPNSIMATGYQTKSFWLGWPGVPPVKLNIGVEYTYYGNLFSSCTDIDSWTTGLQFPIGFGWKQTSASYNIIDGGRTLAVTVRGTIDYYIIIDGIGHIFTFNHTQYAEFYL